MPDVAASVTAYKAQHPPSFLTRVLMKLKKTCYIGKETA